MKRYIFQIAMIGAVAMGVVSCSNEDPSLLNAKPYVPVTLTRGEGAVAQQCGDFAWHLFANVESANAGKNVAMSPASAAMSLSMLANGAVAETRQEIIGALGFGELDIDDVNSYTQKVTSQLVDIDNTAVLNISNGLFVKGDAVLDSYKTLLSESYSAQVSTFNTPSEGIAMINSWSLNATKGLLSAPNFRMDENTRGVVTNGMYFEGKWMSPFYKSDTDKREFNNADGTKSKIDFMNKKADMGIAGNDIFTLLEMPFGNGAFNFIGILPDEGHSVSECAEWMKGNSLWSVSERLTFKNVDVSIPKFENKDLVVDLMPALLAMGIKRLFVAGACQLDAMTPSGMNGVKVDFMSQSNYFKIDENGAKAATVTTTHVSGIGANVTQVAEMVFDRPFIYLIYEKSTKAVLFMGKVEKL